jgi:hypothetical protein
MMIRAWRICSTHALVLILFVRNADKAALIVNCPTFLLIHTTAGHIHPMVGTPFERSSTPLQKWFYAMHLFTASRHGVPAAKELLRQLGVAYKTVWRIGHEIRKYMGKI